MLKEIKNISQKEESKFRRWFEDNFFQLIVWYDLSEIENSPTLKNIYGFQLCYDIENKEKSLTWTIKDGFSHDNVDSSRTGMLIPSAPIMVANGPFHTSIAEKFFKAAQKIDADVQNFISKKIKEYLD